MFALWSLLRPSRPESVTLGFDSLRYDSGTSTWPMTAQQHEWRRHGASPESRLSVRGKPITVSRSELTGFTLDRIGERQRLTFDHGAERIEIGACLREPEREWLHAVLQRWLQ
jgi:hypothetical protein